MKFVFVLNVFFRTGKNQLLFRWSGQTPARAEITKGQEQKHTRDRGEAFISEVEAVGDGPVSAGSWVVSCCAVVLSAGGGSGGTVTRATYRGGVVPQLGGLGAATIRSSNGTPVTVTIVPQISGKRTNRSCVW